MEDLINIPVLVKQSMCAIYACNLPAKKPRYAEVKPAINVINRYKKTRDGDSL